MTCSHCAAPLLPNAKDRFCSDQCAYPEARETGSRFLNAAQARAFLGMPKTTFWRFVHKHQVPSTQRNRRDVFNENVLRALKPVRSFSDRPRAPRRRPAAMTLQEATNVLRMISRAYAEAHP